MAQVLVRQLDPDTVQRLKARAKRNHRSLQAELRDILERAASPAHGDWKQALAELDRMFESREFSDSTPLIREDRESH